MSEDSKKFPKAARLREQREQNYEREQARLKELRAKEKAAKKQKRKGDQ